MASLSSAPCLEQIQRRLSYLASANGLSVNEVDVERQVQFGYLKRILSIFAFLFSFSPMLSKSKLALASENLLCKIYNAEQEASVRTE